MEKRKAKEATAQFNIVSIGRLDLRVGSLVPAAKRSTARKRFEIWRCRFGRSRLGAKSSRGR
jgi:hypothetical protein